MSRIMGNLQFTNTDWGGFEPSRVARELLGQFIARGCYGHVTRYHTDIFIDYDAFGGRLNVSGLYFIRDSGTHTIFLEQFKTMTGDQMLLGYATAMLKTIGTHMTRAFLIVDTTGTRGNREINVEEFNPEYKGDLERVVRTLEAVMI
jgi:hypothetical protein